MNPNAIRSPRYIGAVWLAMLLVACTQGPSQSSADQPQTAQPVDTAHVATLEKRLDDLSRRLEDLEVANRKAHGMYQSVEFDPGEPAYQRVDSPSGFGSFAVSIQDVRPLGDGVRVKFNFGNPSSAKFSGVKLSLQYGPRFPAASKPGTTDAPEVADNVANWLMALKTKEVTLTDEILPGNWNPIDVTLPEIPADQFGYLSLSLETNIIHLRGG